MTTFKIFFNNNDIRRLTKPVSSYEEFVVLLQELYPQYHCELMIKYVDKEGDRIAVTSQIEWEEMMDELHDEKVIKLYVEEGLHPDSYFKDGPAPEPIQFYSDNISKDTIESDQWEGLKLAVPKCLESLFRDQKIIPSHIPNFIRDAIKVKFNSIDEVDLDVDIPLLFDCLHRKAMECLSSFDREVIQKGKDYLIAMVQMKPDNYIALYNLACADSLLNNVPEALQTLEKAIRNGYSDLQHILSDTDLDNIRNSEGFVKLVSLISEFKNSFVPKEECGDCDCNEDCIEFDEKGIPLSDEPVVLEYDSLFGDYKFVEEPVVVKEEVQKQLNNNLTESFVDLRIKWVEQISSIKSLGFMVDDEVLSLLLEQTSGNVEDVVNMLLQTSKTM